MDSSNEETSLLPQAGDSENTLPPRNAEEAKMTSGRSSVIAGAVAFALIASVITMHFFNATKRAGTDNIEQFIEDFRIETPSLNFSNAYERAYVPLGDGFYKYDHLVEVYKETQVRVIVPDHRCSYSWTLKTSDQRQKESGSSVSLTFLETGWHDLKLKVSCHHTEKKLHAVYPVMSRYVRREIRLLNASDRNDFFDALQIIYQVGQTEGEQLYGQKFRSIHRMVAEHLLGAADKMCDHWHDDAGIMTHHIAFTLEMEQSLQSVNSAVTVPYWDYTQDAYELDDWTDSVIFDNDWFGTASPDNDDHIITEGRWAYLGVGKEANPDGVRNPYALLRSPWNTNPMPYVMRHRYVYQEKDGGWTLPGCVDFFEAWSYGSLGRYFDELNGELHGPVHIMIGGQWYQNTSAAVNLTLTNGGDFLLASKYLWRQGFVRCPELCSDDTPAIHCECSIPGEFRAMFDGAKDFLKGTGLFNLSAGLFNDWTNFESLGCTDEEACLSEVVDILGHVGHAGEMFTSSAPYDPTFWPIHGLADRYLQMKRLLNYDNVTMLDQDWGYYHDGNSPSDTHKVCEWDGVTGMEMPKCYTGDCAGHRKHDMLPMGDFLGIGDVYTNYEFYHFMSPLNDDLPYVYDTLIQWPACTTQGFEWWTTTR